MSRLARLVAAALVLATPSAALACPVCAGRAVGNPVGQGLMIAGLVFFPFVVVLTVVRFIRSGPGQVPAEAVSMGARAPKPGSLRGLGDGES